MLKPRIERSQLTGWIRDRILERNEPCRRFFEREAVPLAKACREMAARFLRGGRLFAFGKGPYSTDAQHVSVEFIHPVIVGKRALPALDVSISFDAFVDAVVRPNDMALAFGPPEGDPEMQSALNRAKARGAMTIAFPGTEADYAVAAPSDDIHIHQELFELMGHTLYESVHVFLEHRSHPDEGGAASFLYPFLSEQPQSLDEALDEVVASIGAKANDAIALREEVAARQSEAIGAAAIAIAARLQRGGSILAFGNGGSATDATDFVLDCILHDGSGRTIPAISLALEPAVITATANDVGTEVIFLRQLIAQSSGSQDIALAFSTSGGSRNVVVALEEARKRGLLTVALLGYDGGEIVRRNLADIAIVVHCDYIPRIQEAQGTIYHVLREALDQVHAGT